MNEQSELCPFLMVYTVGMFKVSHPLRIWTAAHIIFLTLCSKVTSLKSLMTANLSFAGTVTSHTEFMYSGDGGLGLFSCGAKAVLAVDFSGIAFSRKPSPIFLVK